jgi:hypothetical protein
VGVTTPDDTTLTYEGLNAYRDAYCNAIHTFHAQGKMAKKWPLQYLIRHTAFHTLDHAWEMEDKDMTDRSWPPNACVVEHQERAFLIGHVGQASDTDHAAKGC